MPAFSAIGIAKGIGSFLISPVGRALMLATALVGALWWFGHSRYEAGETKGSAKVQAKFDKHLAADQKASEQAARDAREAELKQRADLDAIAARAEKEKDDALLEARHIADGLRTGAVRLRNEWAACETARRVSEATAGTSELDGADELRRAGIERVFGIVGTCQAQRDGLIAAVRALTGETP